MHASAQNGALGSTQNLSPEETTASGPLLTLDHSSTKIGLEELLNQTSILPKVHESSVKPEVVDLGSEFKENETTSIFEKIFGNSVTVNVSNSAVPTEVTSALILPFSIFPLSALF